MNNQLRKRILTKLSQTNPSENLPTTQIINTKTVSGTPPNFTASNNYPDIFIAFLSRDVAIINALSNALNQALYYTSSGHFNLSKMYSNNFNLDTSSLPSPELKNIVNFIRMVYMNLYTNNGSKYTTKLTSKEISDKINRLKYSFPLNNLSSTNPIGQLAAKIGGNVKSIIINYLSQIA